jgi:asparagine synthase (glutamine-hydrolysing)
MCGIDGIFSSSVVSNLYYTAHKLLDHRGPDDEGFIAGYKNSSEVNVLSGDKTTGKWKLLPHILENNSEKNWVMGHHRLSIVDLSENGHQPMIDESGRYWLCMNGEIYNYKELRDELTQYGYSFFSNTDTEVVLKAFIKWDVGSFNKFNGMWALAIYDKIDRRLILSRDRLGIKPLYYHLDKEQFIFASEVKFFKPLIKLNIDQNVAAEYIAQCYLDHRQDTFYQEIKQVPAAHYAIYSYEDHFLRFHKFWSIDGIEKVDRMDFQEAEEQFENLFSSAIDLRMRSDVPVGALLSGGLDSTAIVCNLYNRGKFPTYGFNSYSADFLEKQFSEKIFIDQTVANCHGLNPFFIYPDPNNLKDDLSQLLWIQEFPFRSLAVYSQHLIYKTIKQSSPVVVLLNGQGSDELFGGYTTHYYSLISSKIFHLKLKDALNNSRWFLKNRNISKKSLIKYLLKQSILRIFTKNLHFIRALTNPYFSTFPNNLAFFHDDPFENELRTNLLYASLPEYLRYEDRNSMAWALESRLPFLDYRLVEWAFSLPDDFKIYNGMNKRIVRESVKAYTTKSVIERKDKMGFVSPQELWQRTVMKEFMTEVIHSNWEIPFLLKEKVMNGFDSYMRGSKNDWPFWWRIFCYIYWMRTFKCA